MRQKIIRDAVHGYIAIDEPVMRHIVDTEYFQRLRRVEQTSMRPLYPSARHDRFIHSLGAYFLGKKAFECFNKNVRELETIFSKSAIWRDFLVPFKELLNDKDYWISRQFNFEMACLLHDVSHSPFSHTLEDFFAVEKCSAIDPSDELEGKPLYWRTLTEKLRGNGFNSTAECVPAWAAKMIKGPKPHEVLSAVLIVDKYTDALNAVSKELSEHCAINADIEFIIRSVMGFSYDISVVDDRTAVRAHMDNCLISLVHGESLDVDRLDYLLRDVQSAGYDSTSIDVDRLLRALTLEPHPSFQFKLALRNWLCPL